MDPLFNNATQASQTPQTAGEDAGKTTLPTADVSGVRSAAMGAAAAGARIDTQPVFSLEQIRILIGGDTPLSSAYAAFNGGRGVPFTSQNMRDTLLVIDALSRLTDHGGIGLSGIRSGEFRNSAGLNHQRPFPYAGTFPSHKSDDRQIHATPRAPNAREHDRGADAVRGASAEHSRNSLDRPVVPKEQSRADHLKERLERAFEKLEQKTVDPPISLRVERPVTLNEKGPGIEQPGLQLAPTPTAPEISRAAEASRTQDGPPPAKDTSNLITAAISAILNDARNDTARVVTQVLASDQTTRPQHDPSDPSLSRATPYTNPFEARERVQEKLSQIGETLQAIIERSSPVTTPSHKSQEPAHQSYAQSVQGDFSRVDVTHQNVKPVSTIEMQDRGVPNRDTSAPSSLRERGALERGHERAERSATPVSSDSTIGPLALRAAGAGESTSIFAPLEKGTTLVEALSKSTQKVLNVHLLQKLDRALETVVISGAAAIALGVMGGEALLKQLLALSREILARLRESGPFTDEQDAEYQSIEEKIEDLEESCRDRGVETTERSAGFVADITGVIVNSADGLPVEGVVIDAGPLGSTVSDTFGEFRIANIALDTGFSLTCHDHRYAFFPNPVLGTVSTMNHFTIDATKLR